MPQELRSPSVKRALTKNPQTLANALIEGKTSEKEKFDALFAWVVNNIRYDYKSYNSGKGNRVNNPLKRVLRRRKGVCTDYARLMDALCSEVGIDNRTIEGYTKEIVFDINDTLYFDNHAWNAVKLNDLWYLYDATWSSGALVTEYSRLAKWRINKIDELKRKTKKKRITLLIGSRTTPFCKEGNRLELRSVEVEKVRLIPRIVKSVLLVFPFRLTEKYRRVHNANYYLTQPEVFAITHFPNNPIWSFQNELNSVIDFSADSAFFYHSELDYANQKREGRFCINCYDIFTNDEIGREKYQILTSTENNPKNRLVPANAYLNIAEIFSHRFCKENDSLAKMALYDSVRCYINLGRIEYRNSRRANAVNKRFQRKKNHTKKTLLFRENRLHFNRIKNELKETKSRYIKFKSLRIKAKLYLRRGRTDVLKLNKSFTRQMSSKPLREERKVQIRRKLAEYIHESDSLSRVVNTLKDSLNIHASELWSNLMKELNVFDPLLNLFWDDSWQRYLNLLDNQDLVIQQIRLEMIHREGLIHDRIDHNILLLADKTYDEYIEFNKAIKKRNNVDIRAAGQVRLLNAGAAISNDSLRIIQSNWNQRMKADVCWNYVNLSLMDELTQKFFRFNRQNRNFARAIKQNSASEHYRAFVFNKYNQRNAKRVKNVIKNNSRILSKLKREIIAHRQKYLKRLKRQQK